MICDVFPSKKERESFYLFNRMEKGKIGKWENFHRIFIVLFLHCSSIFWQNLHFRWVLWDLFSSYQQNQNPEKTESKTFPKKIRTGLLKNIMENAENRDKNPQFKKPQKFFLLFYFGCNRKSLVFHWDFDKKNSALHQK